MVRAPRQRGRRGGGPRGASGRGGPGRGGGAAAGDAGGKVTVGFRPEALQVGGGPLSARIRTVEDLGSEMFVHVAVDNSGDSVPTIATMTPSFGGGHHGQ